jgi:hypothetical protein
MRQQQRYKMTSDSRPSNPVLHQENQESLNRLMRLREEQDKGYFPTVSVTAPSTSQSISTTISDTHYTPWKTPSTN